MSIIGLIYRETVKLIYNTSGFFSSKETVNKRHAVIIYEMGYNSISKTEWTPNKNVDYIRCRHLELLREEVVRRKISGAVAELGVFRGDFSAEINRLYPESKLYLFDTFEGFNETDMKHEEEHGYTRDKTFKNTNCFKDTNVDIVLSKMVHPELCVVKKGYFPSTAEGLEESFIFVSIDCDLYLPILAGLKYFYPRLVNGGYIMIHDYNSSFDWQGVKEAVADFEKEFGQVNKFPLPDNCGSLIITK